MDNKQPVILVVEDDADIRELVAFSLEEEGYHVEHAADGLRGQEMAETLKPDLIILDLMLPGKDGLSVCRDLNRHAAENMPCPILMLTRGARKWIVLLALNTVQTTMWLNLLISVN